MESCKPFRQLAQLDSHGMSISLFFLRFTSSLGKVLVIISLCVGLLYRGNALFIVKKNSFDSVIRPFHSDSSFFYMKSLGNHEFDDGIEGLLPFVKNANHPVIIILEIYCV